MKKNVIYSCACLFFYFNLILFNAYSQENRKPNVLFIAIDDLKPILGCYGDSIIKTPNIDRLAAMGTVFLSNYCQQAVCGPTRASLMTGKRPDYTKVWDLKTPMRNMNPDILSLPQYFANQGYSTQGLGKVYDSRDVDKDNDKPSWTVPYYKTDPKYYDPKFGEPANGRYQQADTKKALLQYFQEGIDQGMKKSEANEYALKKLKPTTECINAPDNAYNDGANALQAKDILANLSKQKQPFFFAVGFSKPHLPFISPKKYWDLYDRNSMPVAPFQEKTKNAVDVAYHNAGELRAYTDIEPLSSFSDTKKFGVTLPLEKQKELIHGYYAAISYTDAQVGILLRAIDSLGLSQNTIIVLWGDHGWHLGDHNLWCKHTNFEQATRAPLIISSPGLKAGKSNAQTEFVDIFPTLCDLAGLKIPEQLDGLSLVPLMKNTKSSVKEFSVSQYPRSGNDPESDRLGYASSKVMGYSLRTSQYRYTVWMKNDFRSTQPFDNSLVLGEELYDYREDPFEKENVISEKKYAEKADELRSKMRFYFKSQETR